MTARENIMRALRRQDPEWVPWGMDLCESLQKDLKEQKGSNSFWDYFDLPYRYVFLNPTRLEGQYDSYYDKAALKPGTTIDEWGVAHQPVGLAHFTQMLHPMKDFTQEQQVWDFPLPDLMDDYRWVGVAQRVEEVKQQGLMAVFAAVQVFEPAWYLRGMENMLMDLYDDSEIAAACLERICALQEQLCARLAECGFDMIIFGDDVGTQESLMVSKEIWRAWLKPTMQRCIGAAKAVKPDILAYYHSDGNIEQIIGELIEIGVDVLNPVQPECMDPARVKQEYGDRLSFWGTVGTQTTMPFGTPEEVEDKVVELIRSVGVGGGLVIAPTHLLEPEVPIENIMAFYNAVLKYGKYK